MTDDRRVHQRLPCELEFYCCIDGCRFDGAAVDISGGGVLLATDARIRIGAKVLVVPKKEVMRTFPVMLPGNVVRRQAGTSRSMSSLPAAWRPSAATHRARGLAWPCTSLPSTRKPGACSSDTSNASTQRPCEPEGRAGGRKQRDTRAEKPQPNGGSLTAPQSVSPTLGPAEAWTTAGAARSDPHRSRAAHP